MAYDEVFKHIGEIGRYQWTVFAMVFSATIFIFDSFQMVFVGGDMDHWCHVDELIDLPYLVQKNVAIPTKTSLDGTTEEFSSCEMFALDYGGYNKTDFEAWNRTQMISNYTRVVRCKQWTYDQTTFESTIVSKFNLVCGWGFLNQLVSSIYMAGVFVGSVTAGFMSDRYGRKKTMVVYSSIKFVGTFMSIFGQSYTIFVLGRFLMGCGLCGYFIPGYVLVAELVGASYRTILGCGLQMGCAVGFMLQAVIAYSLRNEFHYQLAATGFNYVLPLTTLFLIPESPRWLMLHGKHETVLKLIKHICRLNGTSLPEDFDPASIKLVENVAVKQKNCFALLTSSVMRVRTLVIDFSWFTCSLMAYALSLNTGSLHGNIYVNTFISGAVEVPAYILALLMMDSRWFGRRWTGCLSLVGAGLASFLYIPMILLRYLTAATAFAMLGKAFISVAYAVVYVFAPEVFPTEVRNVAMGTASMLARIGSMGAPFVGGPLAVVWKPLPFLIFGILATLSGLTYILMPETLGKTLPDTIEQVQNCGRQEIQQNLRLIEVTDFKSQDDKESDIKAPLGTNDI